MVAIELYYLVKRNGSVTEVLYGFQRAGLTGERLNPAQILISLADLLGIPWLKSNLHRIYPKYQKLVKQIILLIDGLSILCKLGYIYGPTDAFSLPMLLGRIAYVRTNDGASTTAGLMPFQSWLGTGLFAVRFLDWWRTQSGLNESSPPTYIPPPATSEIQ